MRVILSVLALALSATAAPLTANQLDGLQLNHDDALVLLSNGESHVVKKNEIDAFEANLNKRDASPVTAASADKVAAVSRRGSSSAGNVDLIVPLPDMDFLDWDIAMSTVVHAKDRDTTLAISAGQTIASGFTAGTGVTLTLVPDFLQVSGNYDQTHTTTSVVTGTVTFIIPNGTYGTIVSNPRTFRSRGYTWSGKPGNGAADYWQYDSHTDATFDLNGGTLKWVQGVITTCTSDTYPVKMCVGDDYLH